MIFIRFDQKAGRPAPASDLADLVSSVPLVSGPDLPLVKYAYMAFEVKIWHDSKVYTWNLGEEKPKIPFGYGNELFTISYLKASGNELEYIKRNFTGIPIAPNTEPNVWRSNSGQFIFDNL